MKTNASTVAEYLAELPEDRRAAIKAVRAVVNVIAGAVAAGPLNQYVALANKAHAKNK